MTLPQLTTPEFQTPLPSTQEAIHFRPFLVKEEKMLLMAQQGKDQKEILNVVFQILENCIKSPLEVRKLAPFDLEWLFLQLRAKSVGEVIELRLNHMKEECGGTTDVEINISDIKVHFPEKKDDVVMMDDNIGIKMRYPSVDMVDPSKFTEDPNIKDIFELLDKCIINVFDANQVYGEFTSQELTTFLEGLDQKQFAKIVDFFNNTPKLKHTVKYTCAKCGEEVNYQLEGLLDFFS
jgi:hypothetical protein